MTACVIQCWYNNSFINRNLLTFNLLISWWKCLTGKSGPNNKAGKTTELSEKPLMHDGLSRGPVFSSDTFGSVILDSCILDSWPCWLADYSDSHSVSSGMCVVCSYTDGTAYEVHVISRCRWCEKWSRTDEWQHSCRQPQQQPESHWSGDSCLVPGAQLPVPAAATLALEASVTARYRCSQSVVVTWLDR